MTSITPNAAAFLGSFFACALVFTVNAWRKGAFQAGLVTALAAAFNIALIAMNLAKGEDISRYERAVAIAPGFVAAAFLFGAELVGLPDWLSVRLGFGFHDPRATFYEKIRVPWRQVNSEMEAARREPHGRYGHLRKASSLVERIFELKAPTPEWSDLRDDVVRCQRDWIELARQNRNPEHWPAKPHPYPVLTDRFLELGHEITAERGVSLEEYGSRNNRALKVVALTALVVAVPGVALSWSSHPIQNQWLWLELCVLYLLVLPMVAVAIAALSRFARWWRNS